MIDLKSCRFDNVRATLDKLVKIYGPLQEKVAALIKDPEKRTALYRRLLSKRSIGMPRDPIIELLKIDPRFFKFYADIVALDREAGMVPGQVAVWDELTAHETGHHAVERLRGGAAGQRRRGAAPARRRRSPDGTPGRGPGRPGPPRRAPGQRRGRPFAKEAETTLALAVEARKLRAQLVVATSTIANKALVDLDKRLRELLRRARLTHIDAVIGKKKKLEIEIANLRQGRFPADLFATLQLEGLMGDDEEYWPFEGEYWSDEYENYK